MSDILTRLLLNTGDYDSKLAKAKKSSNDFAANIGGKAAAAVGKFAAGIGIAMGGVEAFNKVMRSTQTLSDAFDNNMNALKGSVDAFFQSLASGNWDAFNGGLMETIRNLKGASVLKDALADAKLSMNFGIKEMEGEFTRLESIIRDETKSKAEREAANVELQDKLAEFRQRVDLTAQGAATTLLKDLSSRFGKEFTLGDVETFFKEVNNEFLNTDTLQRLNEYKANLEKLKGGSYVFNGVVTNLKQYKAQNQELEKLRLLQDDIDAKRLESFQEYEYILELKKKTAEYDKRSLESQTKIASLNKGTTTGKKDTNALKVPVVVSQVAYDTPIGKKMLEAMNGKTFEPIKVPIEIEEEIDEEDLSGKWAEHLTKEQKKVEDMNSALASTADIFGSLGSIAGSAGNDFLAATMQSMGSIAQMILQLQSLTTAQGVASASKLPFPANLAAIATVVATVASVFASLPKFAEGGIVGGSSYFGDKLLCRLNSGEAVLTQSQQARALALMDGGSNVRVSGDVRLSGKDIYISLRNYMATSGNKL